MSAVKREVIGIFNDILSGIDEGLILLRNKFGLIKSTEIGMKFVIRSNLKLIKGQLVGWLESRRL